MGTHGSGRVSGRCFDGGAGVEGVPSGVAAGTCVPQVSTVAPLYYTLLCLPYSAGRVTCLADESDQDPQYSSYNCADAVCISGPMTPSAECAAGLACIENTVNDPSTSNEPTTAGTCQLLCNQWPDGGDDCIPDSYCVPLEPDFSWGFCQSCSPSGFPCEENPDCCSKVCGLEGCQ